MNYPLSAVCAKSVESGLGHSHAYLVCHPGIHESASLQVKGRLWAAQERGRPAILVRALSGSGMYTLYEAGRRHHFAANWRKISSEPSSYRPAIAAMRYRRPEDVVAMTSVAAKRIGARGGQ